MYLSVLLDNRDLPLCNFNVIQAGVKKKFLCGLEEKGGIAGEALVKYKEKSKIFLRRGVS